MENFLETKKPAVPHRNQEQIALGDSKALYKLLYSYRMHVHLCTGFILPMLKPPWSTTINPPSPCNHRAGGSKGR